MRISQDRLHDVIEIMGHPPGQLTDRLHPLGLSVLLLGHAFALAFQDVPEAALDGRRQTGKIALEHEVTDPQLEEFHRLFLTKGTCDHNNRQIGARRLDQVKALLETKLRHAVVGQHQIPIFPVDGLFQIFQSIHTSAASGQLFLLDMSLDPQEVGIAVFNNQDI